MSAEIGTEIRGRHKAQEAYWRVGVSAWGVPHGGDDKCGPCVTLLISPMCPVGPIHGRFSAKETTMTRNQRVLSY